jgi:hypothetical protein
MKTIIFHKLLIGLSHKKLKRDDTLGELFYSKAT